MNGWGSARSVPMVQLSKRCLRMLAASAGKPSLLAGLLAVAASCLAQPSAPSPAPSRLTGRVCLGDRGVARALLRVASEVPGSTWQPGTSNGLKVATLLPSAFGRSTWCAATDASGGFDLQVLASGDLQLYVDMPGGGPAPPVPVHLAPDQACTVEVDAAGPHIEGRVVESGSERALADASLSLTWLPVRRPATSDVDGRFVLACVPSENTAILVEHVGHVPRLFGPVSVARGSTEDALIPLDPEAIVEGDVFASDGRPVPDGTSVGLIHEEREQWFPCGDKVLLAETTAGHFQFRGVPASRCNVAVKDPVSGDFRMRVEFSTGGANAQTVVDAETGKTAHLSITLPAGQ
jgi:hypothetical protein